MRKEFVVPVQQHAIIGDMISETNQCKLFCLHGAGTSDRFRFDRLRERLFEKGVSSCAFDFPGHGETGGELSRSSLYERTEAAEAVIRKFAGKGPLTIIGASMSGYTAVRLLESFEIHQLVLIVPAAYDEAAYELPFHAGFTACIRRENSFLDSDAWGILREYKGKILLVTAELDQVIPQKVIELYQESAPLAEVEHLVVKDVPHKILGAISEEVLCEIAEKIQASIE